MGVMSTTQPTPGPEAPKRRPSIWHNPWLWGTAGLIVVAIALGIWGAHEKSNADDAKSDLAAQHTATPTPAATQPQPTAAPTETPSTADSGDDHVRPGVVAGAVAAIGAARKS